MSEHIPWSKAPESSFTPWVSEGSISVRDGVLQRSLRPRQENHIARTENTSEASVINGANWSPATVFYPSLRKNLMHGKDPTIQPNEQAKQLSPRASAMGMAPNVVDLDLDLQDVGSSVNGQVDIGVPRTMPGLPTLMLSTSTNNTSLSLESSSSLLSEKPLAIRRGRNLPEPLVLSQPKSYKNDFPYSSIPTSFLGSSPSFSPNSEGCINTPASGLSLDEMISELKSRCASLRGRCKSLTPVKEKPLPAPPMASARDVENNKWDFAGDLLSALENVHTAAATFEEIFRDDDPGTVSSCTVVSCSPQSDTTLGDDVVEHQISNIYGPPTAPPSISLPCPTSTHQKRVRGILKSTKCVRFAILPGEDQIDPRDSLDALPIITLSDNQDIKPQNRKPLTSSMKHSSRSSYRDEVSNTAPRDSSAGKISERKAGSRRVSESSATGLPSPMRASAIPKGRLPVFSLGRHSLGAKTGRETQARATSFQKENDSISKGSIGKNVRVRDSGSQKSRMPVAVQKMFMRFK